MQINPQIFREYDIRGIAGKDLTEDVVERVAQAFTVMLRNNRKHNTVCIARDGRLSSKGFMRAIVNGITSCGVNVIDLGETPTPLLYFGLFNLPVDGGIMITGSHNPKEYNGMKVAIGNTTIHGKEIQKLGAIAMKGGFKTTRKPVTIRRMDIVPKYIAKVARIIDIKRRLKVVVDAGNGVGGRIAVPLYEKLGCEVIPLYCDVDGNFPNHHPDPTLPASLKKLIATVRRVKADCGIAFDGDADRIGGVDNTGEILWGDKLLVLFARSILREKPGATVIGEVKCSRTLYNDIEKSGGKPVMWKTGHSLIKAAM
ncbi:MAG TPA: phosphomannomutase/phosphoglucomutase, partial [Candidatus Hydrogenedentes bacterium]|nr:phosphomannomutase/phosphoglucomutase [Candidatus Hydrogenedentota bacterium]HOT50832.1 phosphomannomutase/phosphoglucomutase [Candidatus Hydrogenedentota bacterium]